jgi:3-dehydrosphinganine reductase
MSPQVLPYLHDLFKSCQRENDMAQALITGGSSGIGLALATRLVREGHAASLFARDAARLAAARERILALAPSAQVLTYSVDVGDREACVDAVRRAIEEGGPPSWAIACAGVVKPYRFLDQSFAAHQEQMQTNYFGSLNLAQAVVPTMIANGGGRLVFVSSAAAICGIYGYSGYGASKFAVRGLAESLRVELRPEGIAVTIVYAPDTDTPQLAVERAERSAITARIADAGGLWQAQDVADAVIRGALRGKFVVAPGLPVRLLHILQGLVAPVFRLRQDLIIASMASRR